MKTNTENKGGDRFGRHLKSRIISGLLVLGPLMIILFILKIIFAALTAFVLPLIKEFPILRELPEWVLVAVATIIALIMIYLVGMFTTHLMGRRFINLGETLMMKLPMALPDLWGDFFGVTPAGGSRRVAA